MQNDVVHPTGLKHAAKTGVPTIITAVMDRKHTACPAKSRHSGVVTRQLVTVGDLLHEE